MSVMWSQQYLLNQSVQLLNQCDIFQKANADDREAFTKLLRQLKSGEVKLDALVVTDNGWDIIPPLELPKKAEKKEESA